MNESTTLIAASESLFGTAADAAPHRESFSIGRSRDGDMWPSLSLMSGAFESARDRRFHAMAGGRYRTPGAGGGSSDRLFSALLKLSRLMERDEHWCANGSQGHLGFFTPLRPRPYVERHMDDGSGYFGIEVLKGGVVVLHMRPRPETWQEEWQEYDGMNSPVSVRIGPQTPYQLTYAALPLLYKAVVADNRRLGDFGGNHAF